VDIDQILTELKRLRTKWSGHKEYTYSSDDVTWGMARGLEEGLEQASDELSDLISKIEGK